MGYNGSNRLGHDRRYQGFKKSSNSVGNSLSKQVNKTGVLMTGKLLSNTPSTSDVLYGLSMIDFTRGDKVHSNISTKKLTFLVCFLLMLVPAFHWLCYYSYSHWGWWAFFSFLVFGTLSLVCIGLSERILDTNAVISFRHWRTLGVCIIIAIVANILFGLWPFWDSSIDLAYLLIIYQDLASLFILLFLHGVYTRYKTKKK